MGVWAEAIGGQKKRIGIEGRDRTGKNRQSRRSGGDAETNERN